MNKKIKFNDQNKKIWVGSDFHIHHDRDFIWKPRGFSSVEESDRWILEDINSLVKQDDVLLYLGDGMLNARGDNDFERFFERIICNNIYYIWGNHEGPSFEYYKRNVRGMFELKGLKGFDQEVYPIKFNNINFLGNYAEVEVNRQSVTLTHYPFTLWNKSHHGTWNLCGHSHGSNKNALPSAQVGKVLDCGVDVAKNYWNHSIFSWEKIEQIMNKKSTPVIDHHDNKTT